MAGNIMPIEADLSSITNVIGSKLHTNYYSLLRLLQSPSYRQKEVGKNIETFLRKLDYAETQFLIDPTSVDTVHKIGLEIRNEGVKPEELDSFQKTWDDVALRIKLQYPKWLRDSQFMLLYGTWAIGEHRRTRSVTWVELKEK